MILLVSSVIIFIALILYFAWIEVNASVYPRLGFKDSEPFNLDDIKFVKYFPKE